MRSRGLELHPHRLPQRPPRLLLRTPGVGPRPLRRHRLQARGRRGQRSAIPHLHAEEGGRARRIRPRRRQGAEPPSALRDAPRGHRLPSRHGPEGHRHHRRPERLRERHRTLQAPRGRRHPPRSQDAHLPRLSQVAQRCRDKISAEGQDRHDVLHRRHPVRARHGPVEPDHGRRARLRDQGRGHGAGGHRAVPQDLSRGRVLDGEELPLR
mmetsp:Transcript_31278/g.91596  ORF Transcript_31278/g.91596 Transcript_31278/m.91596 type:complete len:210 (+) Transcript_31278:458-1087(+)